MTGTRCTVPRKWSCCDELVAPKDLEKHIIEYHFWRKEDV